MKNRQKPLLALHMLLMMRGRSTASADNLRKSQAIIMNLDTLAFKNLLRLDGPVVVKSQSWTKSIANSK